MLGRLFIFLLINFGAIALGGFFTGKGVTSEWYLDLAKAPWTPPGWFFGVAWTTIMICFSIYLSYLWPSTKNLQTLLVLYGLQFVLNVAWSPVFFYYHNVVLALFIISTLTIVVGVLLFSHWQELQLKSLLLAPYFVWLLVATSLNAYILVNN